MPVFRLISEAVQRHPTQPVDKFGQILNQSREIRFPLIVAFVHVKRPLDFDLQRMTLRARMPVMPRREPARVGRVDRNGEAAFDEEAAGGLDELWGAGCAVAVPQHDVGPTPLARRIASRRHRMAIDE